MNISSFLLQNREVTWGFVFHQNRIGTVLTGFMGLGFLLNHTVGVGDDFFASAKERVLSQSDGKTFLY